MPCCASRRSFERDGNTGKANAPLALGGSARNSLAFLSCAPIMSPLDDIDFRARKDRKFDEEEIHRGADRRDSARGGDPEEDDHGAESGARDLRADVLRLASEVRRDGRAGRKAAA